MGDGLRQDKCALVISADVEEEEVLEAWSLSIGWSGEPNSQAAAPISQEQARNCSASSHAALSASALMHLGPSWQALKTSVLMLRSLFSLLRAMPLLPPVAVRVRVGSPALAAPPLPPRKKTHCLTALNTCARTGTFSRSS